MPARQIKGVAWRPFLCLCIAAAALLAPGMAPATGCAPTGTLQNGHVRYVIDGDTVILDGGRHIRIIGLNTPEIGHDGAPDEPFARAARHALIKLLARTHDKIEWSIGPETHDHYGRTLAHIYINGQDASQLIIAAGLAAVIAIPPNIRRATCYAQAERHARAQHIGLWSKKANTIRTGADALSSGFEIVRSRVTRVARKHSGTLLSLAIGLNIWIPADDRHFFHHPLSELADHRVLVRGWQYPFHGHPEIVVRHPATLTVLPAISG